MDFVVIVSLQAEVEELQEFELLERFVDDNASLISNVSVNKILPLALDSTKRQLSSQKSGESQHPVHHKSGLLTDRYMADSQSSNSDEDDDDDGVEEDAVENVTLINDETEISPSSAVVNGLRNTESEPPSTLQAVYRKILSSRTNGFPDDAQHTTSRGNNKSRGRSDDANNQCDITEGHSDDDESDLSDTESINVIDAVMKDAPAISNSILAPDHMRRVTLSASDGKEPNTGVEFNDDAEWRENSFAEKNVTASKKYQGWGSAMMAVYSDFISL